MNGITTACTRRRARLYQELEARCHTCAPGAGDAERSAELEEKSASGWRESRGFC